jgi:murein DD-endopeptidase MepM/ murein hydrolase activator NlpD
MYGKRPDLLADFDLAVDLGDRIGSASWWRGMATLLLLCFTVVHLGARITPLPQPSPAPLAPEQFSELAPSIVQPLSAGGATGYQAPPTEKVARLAEPPERPRIEAVARIGRRDTLEAALVRAGVGREEATQVAGMISGEIATSRLPTSTEIALVLGRRETKDVPRPLEHLGFRAAFDLKLAIERGGDGSLKLKRIPIKVDDTPLRISTRIGSSLYKSARGAGLPAGIVNQYVKLLSYSVDFQRDVGASDRFDIIVEHKRAETGETQTGGLLFAAFRPAKGKAIELMRWDPAGDRQQFFDARGGSVKRGLMKTPVDGARLTSGFGMRRHPILGYSRLHRGVDFGAPHGAPVMAAASGTVEFAGRHGGHGNYLKIKHRNGLSTAYAHLSRFAVRSGAKVEQGQVIAYVGSTGMSTGPHLHYEVYVKGKPVNPRSADLPTGIQLAGSELARFKAQFARLQQLPPEGTDNDRRVVAATEEADANDG